MPDAGLGLHSTTTTRNRSTKDERKRHEFSISLYRQLCSETDNVIASPYSIRQLLAVLCEGSAGETREELITLLGSSGPIEQIVTTYSHRTQLNIATSLWTNRDHPIKQPFLDAARDSYGAKTESLDFADPQSVALINDWVSANTAGKIQRILVSLGRDERLVGVNAVYFKGQWRFPFKEGLTSDRAFKISTTESKPVPTMQRSRIQGYFENSNIQAIKLDYHDSTLSMIVVLPRRVDGLADFTGSLDSDSYSSILGGMEDVFVRLQLPRFKIQAKYADIITKLKKLGIKKLFDPVHADLTGVSDCPLFVSSIAHRALAEVNEIGTEAAAVTSTGMFLGFSGMPQTTFAEMTVDHPFFFTIHDMSTDAILFMGSVFDPTS